MVERSNAEAKQRTAVIPNRRTPSAVTAVIALVASAITGLVVAPVAHAVATASIQITEFAYGGVASYAGDTGDGEYIELTNTGSAAQDFTGWHYNTTSSATGAIDLSSVGTAAPGESVIITDLTAADFRTEWGLKSSVKVINDGAVTLNKGPKTMSILDASGLVVDQLTYASGYLSGKGVAAWVNPGHLADTDTATAGAWTNPATVADAEGSWKSAHGAIGSPAASTQGTSSAGSVRTGGVSVSGAANQNATTNTPFTFAGLSASGGASPYTWSAPALSGTGLNIDPSTGAITGTPALVGGITVTAIATDSASMVGSASFVITVTPGLDPNWAHIVINELTSDNDDNTQLTGTLPTGLYTALSTAGKARDLVELYNTGSQPVDITGWRQIDSGGAASATVFSGRVFDVNGNPITSIPGHGFGVFQSGQGLGSGGDAVKIYLPDGTLVDSVTYGAGQAGYESSLDPSAVGPTSTTEVYHTLARCPADGAGVVNSNSSDPSTAWYSVKLASIGSSNDSSCDTSADAAAAVRHFNEQPPTGLPSTCSPSAPSGSNVVAVPDALAWPTTDGVTTADIPCEFITAQDPTGNDISGLVFSGDGSVLWGAQNKNHLWKLVKDPATGNYLPATDNGWGNGKAITFAGTDPAISQPDSEGLTIGGNGGLFVTSERDNHASNVSKDAVLEYDPTTPGATLIPVRAWDLTSEFVPSILAASGNDSNLGFEGVTYVPDSFLTSHGFRDQHLSKTYAPADYPLHGTGLFFVGLEKNGHVYAYALNSDGTYQRVADIDTGIDGTSAIADLQFNADDQGIWTQCDNDCGVVASLLRIGAEGDFTRLASYNRPAGLPDDNMEGFAIAPASTATNGKREVVWSDDGIYGDGNAWNSDRTSNVPSAGWGHALYSGTIFVDAAPSSITGTVTPTGTVGAGYTSSALSVMGAFPNVVTFSISAGSLPPGLTLDSTSGAITGTPTTPGSFSFTIAASNGVGDPATKVASIVVTGTLVTRAPVIEGSTKVGSKLSVTVAPWGPSAVTLTYQWFADNVAIDGATGPTFHATGDYLHKTLTVVVTGAKPYYISASVASAGFFIVNGSGR